MRQLYYRIVDLVNLFKVIEDACYNRPFCNVLLFYIRRGRLHFLHNFKSRSLGIVIVVIISL